MHTYKPVQLTSSTQAACASPCPWPYHALHTSMCSASLRHIRLCVKASVSCRSPRASQRCQPKAGSKSAQQTGPSCVQSADADQPCSAPGGPTASAIVACARCGCSLSQAPAECRFHPHLLKDPGPFLFSPEWHACKAAGHTEADAGCYVRAGHFAPDAALKLVAAASQRVRASNIQTVPETEVEQPRQHLPQPTMQ